MSFKCLVGMVVAVWRIAQTAAYMQESFNETPTEASGSDELPARLQNVSPDTPVLMYCTGGIRCDVYSSYLRKKVQHTLRLLCKYQAHKHILGTQASRVAIPKAGKCKQDLKLVSACLHDSCQIWSIVSDAESMQGFQNLYTLEKGVQNYMKEKGTDLWKGSLFVFDGRMAVRPGAPHTPSVYVCSNFHSHRL